MLSIRSLRKSYGGRLAVDGLDLEIAPGETFGLLGPNGAGKSTTIRCALGLTRPDGGEVSLRGLGDPREPRVRARIGYAPQELAVYDEMSGIENLRFFGRLHGLRGARLAERIDWALDFAALADRARDRVAGYSGGMKRRLNLACAAVHDPELLLLDEPTVGVDPQSRNHLFETVEQLAAAGKTVLYTTHYMEEAQRLCDRVAVIDHGRVLACDRVDTLLERHGGRSTVEAELEEPPADPGRLPGRDQDRTLRFEADDARDALATLQRAGVAYRTLHVRRPDLESVFLELTGRSLRDA
jgi:ABC-2 type transport system ATP-binding protein